MWPNRKNLIVDVEEKSTGHMSLGAGFSSVDSLVGIAEYNEGNFQAPWFRGGGQKLRLRLTVGTERQDYEIDFHRAVVPGSQTAVRSRVCFIVTMPS